MGASLVLTSSAPAFAVGSAVAVALAREAPGDGRQVGKQYFLQIVSLPSRQAGQSPLAVRRILAGDASPGDDGVFPLDLHRGSFRAVRVGRRAVGGSGAGQVQAARAGEARVFVCVKKKKTKDAMKGDPLSVHIFFISTRTIFRPLARGGVRGRRLVSAFEVLAGSAFSAVGIAEAQAAPETRNEHS